MTSLFANEVIVAYARVAVERSVDRYPDGLTYAIPQSLADLAPGDRVLVPLGRGNTPTPGYVIDVGAETDLDPLAVKPIERRDPAGVRLPRQLILLARWIAGYYCAPIGMTLASMLPAAVKRNVGTVTRTMINLAEDVPPELKLPPKQRQAIETVMALPPEQRPVEIRALADRAGLRTVGPIRRLVDRGLLIAGHRTSVEAAWARQAPDDRVPDRLTEPQQHILRTIAVSLDAGFAAHVLHGVTGSGKTEVYIRLIRKVVDAGQVALILVPEIALTPQTGGRLIGRFPDQRVAILHSGLTAAQRHQHWSMVQDGTARIVLGARSAVFAPVPDDRLGLIVVDEEHDASYKQDQVPRYHGRDVAVRRAQLAGCPVVLGSATPSLESWYNATVRHTYALHTLDERVPGVRLPKVVVVDFVQEQRRRRDRRVHLLGPTLEQAVTAALESGGQVLLLLNRRGYANYIACPDRTCGWLLTCDRCDVTMVYHKDRDLPTGGYVQCHHCLGEQRLPATCPDCGKRIVTFGLGTQRVEEELTSKFPGLVLGETMARVDSDTMHGSRDFHDVLGRFGDGTLRLLVGTQMIAKGLDYPGVRLVGVINADTSINLPDFRASERTFQLISQVAGRSGRGRDPGLVVVQSFSPQAPAIQLAARHDYDGFAAHELATRQPCALPPFSRMMRIVLRDADHARCIAAARQLVAALRPLADEAIRLRGPAPCPIARIAGKHRQQVEALAPNSGSLQTFIASARSAGLIRSDASMAVDVDPVALL